VSEEEEQATERIGNERREILLHSIHEPDPEACISKDVQKQKKTSASALPHDTEERTTEQQTATSYSRRKRIPTDHCSPTILAGGKALRTHKKQQDLSSALKDVEYAAENTETKETNQIGMNCRLQVHNAQESK